MKTIRFSIVAGLLGMLFLLTACEMSLRNDKRYAPFIGKRFKTKEDLFLVERNDSYYFDGERKDDFLRDSYPTFDEFRNGLWGDKVQQRNYKLIIPTGTEVEIIDIVYIFNPEVGDYMEWYGAFVNPPKDINKTKKIYLQSDYDRGYWDPVPDVPPFIYKKYHSSSFVPVDKDG